MRGMLEGKGIAYHPEHQIARAEPGHVLFTDGLTVEAELIIYVPPIAPPAVLRGSGLVDESGWVRVDRHTLETAFPGVYAVGDVTLIPLSMGKPLPRAGVFAHAQAEAVARNIAATVAGKPAPARFDGRGACFIETGAGAAGFGSGNFYAGPRPAVRMRPVRCRTSVCALSRRSPAPAPAPAVVPPSGGVVVPEPPAKVVEPASPVPQAQLAAPANAAPTQPGGADTFAAWGPPPAPGLDG